MDLLIPYTTDSYPTRTRTYRLATIYAGVTSIYLPCTMSFLTLFDIHYALAPLLDTLVFRVYKLPTLIYTLCAVSSSSFEP